MRDDDQSITRALQPAQSIEHAGEQPHARRINVVRHVLDERSVLVEEDRRFTHRSRYGIPLYARGADSARRVPAAGWPAPPWTSDE